MSDVLEVIWHGLRDSLLMVWAVWWALVLGFAISAIVQAWVPRERVQNALAGSGARPLALATGLIWGAAIGAVAGAMAGAIGTSLASGRPTVLYPETILTLRVETPITISTDRAPQAFR